MFPFINFNGYFHLSLLRIEFLSSKTFRNKKGTIIYWREEAEKPAERDLARGVSINGEPMRAALGKYWKELGQHILLLK